MIKAEETSGRVLFEERSSFPGWIPVLVLMLCFFAAAAIVAALFTGQVETSERWEALLIVGISLIIELIVIYCLYILKLEKVMTTNGLYFRWRPFQKRFSVIEKGEIENVVPRKAPLRYGISWSFKYGRVHNPNGKKGLQVYLKNGKKYFFGTSDIAAFHKAVNESLSFNPKYNLREF